MNVGKGGEAVSDRHGIDYREKKLYCKCSEKLPARPSGQGGSESL